MEDKVLDIPPTADQRIAWVHIWIATYADGGEGIMSADLPMEGEGVRHMPLMSSKRSTAEALAPMARRILQQARTQGHTIKSIRLVSFTRINPA